MKKFAPLLAVLILMLASLACLEPAVTPTPTPTPVSALAQGLTMVSDKLNAEATQQKFDSIIAITAQVVAATSTQQAVYVQATQVQQERFDAQATADQKHVWAQATDAQGRRDAQATQQRLDEASTQQALHVQATQQRLDLEATQAQARLDLQATQQAGATNTAGVMTMTAIPPASTLTQIANLQSIELATNQVELSNLKVKQQQDTNVLQWLVPGLLSIFIILVLANWLMKMAKVREIKDENGGTKLLVFDNKRGVVPQLLSGPIVNLETGEVPAVVDTEEQSNIVKRDQAIRALEAMPVNPAASGVEAFNGLFSGAPEPEKDDLPFDFIDADDNPPPGLLNDESLGAINRDWKEAKGE